MLRTVGLSVVLSCCASVGTTFAQNTDDNSVFDFSLPGARSRGIAGAFVAIADDATSVYSNPAGLTNLFRPEVSFEIRHWNLTRLVVDEGHAFGSATNVGIDTIDGIRDRAFTSGLNGLSFLSAVYPRERWAVGLFSHQLARYQMNYRTKGAFFNCRGGFRGANAMPPYCEQSQDDGIDRLFPADQSFEVRIRSSGAALAVDASEALSLGLAVQLFDFDLNSSGRVFAARGARKYAPADFSSSNEELVGRRMGDDKAWGINAGVLWELKEKWSIGATFRQGPEFRYLAQTTTGPANLGRPGVTFVDEPNSPFKVPDTWAVGVAFRPNNYWRIGFEYDRVRFRQLMERVLNTATSPDDPEGASVLERLTLDDSNQLRVGGEYSAHAFGGRLISFRGGLWYDPLHAPYFRVDDPATGYPAPGWSLLFPKRDAEVHVSGGFGFAGLRRFQIDVAVEHAPSVTTVALSAIYRF